MWVAVVLLCSSNLANSCQLVANTNESFMTQESCEVNAANYGRLMRGKGYYVVPSCFKVGEEA